MRTRRFVQPSSEPRGFALVITLVVIALLTIVITAFFSSVSSDRLTARAYLNRVRAEQAAEAGLAKALAVFASPSPLDGFQFASGLNAAGKPVLIPFKADGTPEAARSLYSEGAVAATIPVETGNRIAAWIDLKASDNKLAGRYAYWVDDASSRQNLKVAGVGARAGLADLAELPLIKGISGEPISANARDILPSKRPLFFVPESANEAMPGEWEQAVNSLEYTLASPSALLSPERYTDGSPKPRLNLQKLKEHVDSLSSSQIRGNPKSLLVERLLNPDSSDKGNEWGGGNLSFLSQTSYSPTQQRQIIANLIDYLDADLLPTTDKIPTQENPDDYPTYFGIEGKESASGDCYMHPQVSFVGTGLIFNRKQSNPLQGWLNSTLVIAYLGVVNPTGYKTLDWSLYSLEIEVEMLGQVSGGTLGSDAKAYFESVFSENLTVSPASNLEPHQGVLAPKSVTTTYQSRKNFYNASAPAPENGRQPSNMSFSQMKYRIKKLRLKYNGTGGASGYVQVLDALGSRPMDASPASFSTGSDGSPLIYRLGSGADGGADKLDFHLNSDPRLNFLPNSWLFAMSTVDGSNVPTARVQGSANDPINVFAGRRENESDFSNDQIVTGSRWFSATSSNTVSKHFYIKSPPAISNGSFPAPAFRSIGEVGYFHVGLPWETIRLYATSTASSKDQDQALLSRVWSGTPPSNQIASVLRSSDGLAFSPAIPTWNGQVSVNSDKVGTLQSLFRGSTASDDAEAANRATGAASDPDVMAFAAGVSSATNRPFLNPGEMLKTPALVTWAERQKDDFAKETLARRVANAVTVQSLRFTIYVNGEAQETSGKPLGRTHLRAEVELRADEAGRPRPVVVAKSFY